MKQNDQKWETNLSKGGLEWIVFEEVKTKKPPLLIGIFHKVQQIGVLVHRKFYKKVQDRIDDWIWWLGSH